MYKRSMIPELEEWASNPPEDMGEEERMGWESAVERVLSVAERTEDPEEAADLIHATIERTPGPQTERDYGRLSALQDAFDTIGGTVVGDNPVQVEDPPPESNPSTSLAPSGPGMIQDPSHQLRNSWWKGAEQLSIYYPKKDIDVDVYEGYPQLDSDFIRYKGKFYWWTKGTSEKYIPVLPDFFFEYLAGYFGDNTSSWKDPDVYGGTYTASFGGNTVEISSKLTIPFELTKDVVEEVINNFEGVDIVSRGRSFVRTEDYQGGSQKFIFVISPEGKSIKREFSSSGMNMHSDLAKELGAEDSENEITPEGYSYVRGVVSNGTFMAVPGVAVPFSSEQFEQIGNILSETDLSQIEDYQVEDANGEYSPEDFGVSTSVTSSLTLNKGMIREAMAPFNREVADRIYMVESFRSYGGDSIIYREKGEDFDEEEYEESPEEYVENHSDDKEVAQIGWSHNGVFTNIDGISVLQEYQGSGIAAMLFEDFLGYVGDEENFSAEPSSKGVQKLNERFLGFPIHVDDGYSWNQYTYEEAMSKLPDVSPFDDHDVQNSGVTGGGFTFYWGPEGEEQKRMVEEANQDLYGEDADSSTYSSWWKGASTDEEIEIVEDPSDPEGYDKFILFGGRGYFWNAYDETLNEPSHRDALMQLIQDGLLPPEAEDEGIMGRNYQEYVQAYPTGSQGDEEVQTEVERFYPNTPLDDGYGFKSMGTRYSSEKQASELEREDSGTEMIPDNPWNSDMKTTDDFGQDENTDNDESSGEGSGEPSKAPGQGGTNIWSDLSSFGITREPQFDPSNVLIFRDYFLYWQNDDPNLAQEVAGPASGEVNARLEVTASDFVRLARAQVSHEEVMSLVMDYYQDASEEEFSVGYYIGGAHELYDTHGNFIGDSATTTTEDVSDEESLEDMDVQTLLDKNAGEDLKGLPSKVKIPGIGPVEFHSHRGIQDLAKGYNEQHLGGQEHPVDYVRVRPEISERIAQAFDEVEHTPNDPLVAESYQAMIDESLQQYQAAVDDGYTFEFYPEGEDPYPNTPREAVLDLQRNKHMYVYPTDEGFGSDAGEHSDHPLMKDTGIFWNDKPVLANDIFRAIHDVYGHAKEGLSFRGDGEDNAYRQHAAMFSPLARRAMTSETRGQNSWVNFGPFGQQNQTARMEETVYAPQKATLLPEWVEDPDIHKQENLQVAFKQADYITDKFPNISTSGPIPGVVNRWVYTIDGLWCWSYNDAWHSDIINLINESNLSDGGISPEEFMYGIANLSPNTYTSGAWMKPGERDRQSMQPGEVRAIDDGGEFLLHEEIPSKIINMLSSTPKQADFWDDTEDLDPYEMEVDFDKEFAVDPSDMEGSGLDSEPLRVMVNKFIYADGQAYYWDAYGEWGYDHDVVRQSLGIDAFGDGRGIYLGAFAYDDDPLVHKAGVPEIRSDDDEIEEWAAGELYKAFGCNTLFFNADHVNLEDVIEDPVGVEAALQTFPSGVIGDDSFPGEFGEIHPQPTPGGYNKFIVADWELHFWMTNPKTLQPLHMGINKRLRRENPNLTTQMTGWWSDQQDLYQIQGSQGHPIVKMRPDEDVQECARFLGKKLPDISQAFFVGYGWIDLQEGGDPEEEMIDTFTSRTPVPGGDNSFVMNESDAIWWLDDGTMTHPEGMEILYEDIGNTLDDETLVWGNLIGGTLNVEGEAPEIPGVILQKFEGLSEVMEIIYNDSPVNVQPEVEEVQVGGPR